MLTPASDHESDPLSIQFSRRPERLHQTFVGQQPRKYLGSQPRTTIAIGESARPTSCAQRSSPASERCLTRGRGGPFAASDRRNVSTAQRALDEVIAHGHVGFAAGLRDLKPVGVGERDLHARHRAVSNELLQRRLERGERGAGHPSGGGRHAQSARPSGQ